MSRLFIWLCTGVMQREREHGTVLTGCFLIAYNHKLVIITFRSQWVVKWESRDKRTSSVWRSPVGMVTAEWPRGLTLLSGPSKQRPRLLSANQAWSSAAEVTVTDKNGDLQVCKLTNKRRRSNTHLLTDNGKNDVQVKCSRQNEYLSTMQLMYKLDICNFQTWR